MPDALLLSVPLGSELADARAWLASPAAGTPSMAPPLAAAALAAVAGLMMAWIVIIGPGEAMSDRTAGPVSVEIAWSMAQSTHESSGIGAP